MSDCNLNNNARSGCEQYEGVISGMLIKSVPFEYTPADLLDLDVIKADLIASDDRLFILVDTDDHESIQQRESQNGQTASGSQLFYGQLGHSFALHQRKPRAYDIRKAFLDGAGTQRVYGIPFTTKGFLNPSLIDGQNVAKEYLMTKELMEAVDYTTGEKMIKYRFTEKTPELNVKYMESVLPTEYDPNSLDGVEDVEVTIIGTPLATTIVCTVNLAGESSNIISTLVTANFSKLDASGVVEAVTAVYDSATGQYTLTGTGLTSGTLKVILVVTDAVYYEGQVAVII